jgi:hypothetical protein
MNGNRPKPAVRAEYWHESLPSSWICVDSNGWLLQEVITRLPGRIDSAATSFAPANDLASALRRAEAAR